MSKILVTDDTETVKVHVYPMSDFTQPDDEAEPFFVAACRMAGCGWNSYATDNTIHVRESDAINDAETHLDRHERN